MPDFFNFNRLLGLGLTPPPGMALPSSPEPSYGSPNLQAFAPAAGTPLPAPTPLSRQLDLEPDLLAGPPAKPGFKEILKTGLQTFLYSLGRGLQEGGGMKGAGVAMTAPLELQEVQRQRQLQNLQLLSRLREEKARAARDYAMAQAYGTPKQDLSTTPFEAFQRGEVTPEGLQSFTQATTPPPRPPTVSPSSQYDIVEGTTAEGAPAMFRVDRTTNKAEIIRGMMPKVAKEPKPGYQEEEYGDYLKEWDAGQIDKTKFSRDRLGLRNYNIARSTAGQKLTIDEQTVETYADRLLKGDVTALGAVTGMGAAKIKADSIARAFRKSEEMGKPLPEDWVPKMAARISSVTSFFDLSQPKSNANRLQSFGRYLEHSGEAMDSINNIFLTNSQYANKSINYWRKNFRGSAQFGALIAALEPVRNEVSNFLAQGFAPYEKDKAAAREILDENSSIETLKSSLSTWGRIAKEQVNEMDFSYQRNTDGQHIPVPFSPEAIEGARKLGVDLSTIGGSRKATPSPGAPSTFGVIPGARRIR